VRSRSASALIGVGLLSMLGQVALLRELAVASYGVELVYLAGTACWLAAGAAGALAPPRGDPWPDLGLGFLALAVLLPGEVTFLRGARTLLGEVPGAYLPLGQQLLTAALGLMPAGALLGRLFRGGARAMAGAGGSLAASYGWESLGGALGCVAATASFGAGLSNLALTLSGGAAAAAAGAAFLRGRRRSAALALAGALLLLLALAGPLDRRTSSWNHPLLALVRDTPYGRIALVEAQGQLAVFENDALAWDSEGTDAEALVHPAALQARPAPRVLVLEGGLYGIAAEVLKHRPSRVDVVEMNGAMVRALLPRLPLAGRAALADPAVHLVVTDPRAFLLGPGELYDLVLVGAAEPSSGQVNRLYTAEFFERCSARLAPGGLLALRLPSLENLWTPGLLLRNGAIHAALRAAFADVLVLPGATDVLLASQGTLTRDPSELGTRLQARAVEAREVTPQSLRYLLTNDRAATVARLLATSGAEPNTDERPVCYQQTALLWLGRLVGGAQDARLPGRRPVYALLGALAALTVAARLLARARPLALVAAAAFGAMALESAVVLRYQAGTGALFRDLGALLTAFMTGLSAGAWLLARAGSPGGGRLGRAWGLCPLLALALLSTGFAAAARAGLGLGLVASAAFLLAAGGAVAALFGYASRMGPDRPGAGEAGGALYTADLLGGCLGSLLAGGLLVLVLGLGGTALAVAGVAVAALALV
jgi:spermidine synthase